MRLIGLHGLFVSISVSGPGYLLYLIEMSCVDSNMNVVFDTYKCTLYETEHTSATLILVIVL